MPTRRNLIAAAAIFAATAATAQNTQVPDIAGYYTAHGMNPSGSTYTGQTQIIQQGSAVDIYWTVAGQSYSGHGRIDGRVVTVDWGSTSPVVYVLMGRELHGTWENGTALEKLIPQ